ncbi:MAG: hypothetical protein JWP03_5135 [Phycisphaerales bacterium]|nr:hypothetical protein [Phycisphaerales bacterium]
MKIKAGNKGKQNRSTKVSKPRPGQWTWVEPVEPRIFMSVSYSPINLADFTQSGGAGSPSGVVRDSLGNLYGTIPTGGTNSDGAVFELAAGSRTVTTLASFNSSTGSDPIGGLAVDSSGDLFGTTQLGGAHSVGTVFEIVAGSGTITTLASFDSSTTGDASYAGLLVDSSGNLYGTTTAGGPNGAGTLFSVVAGSNSITVLAPFDSSTGTNPRSALVMDTGGNLYGTTQNGGANGGSSGDGTVFERAALSSSITPLASFSTSAGSAGNVTVDSGGNLYGTTLNGGTNGDGSVFEIVANSGIITTLASFAGTNGTSPQGSLIMDSSGNLFGVTGHGGVTDDGTVFKVAAGSNAITTLVSLSSSLTGSSPTGGVVMDSNGTLYGTTTGGGAHGVGAVFSAGPVAVWRGNGNAWIANDWQGGVLPFPGQSVDFPSGGADATLGSNETVGNVIIEGSQTFNGSTLTVEGNISMLGSSDGAYFSNNVILTHQTTVTVNATDYPTFSSVGDGGLGYGIIKQGAGTLYLNSTLYTGPTEVAQGTLQVSSTAPTGAVTVDPGATYSSFGTTNGIFDNGGTISAGGTDSGSLTFGAGSTFQEGIFSFGGPENDGKLTVTGPSINLTGASLTVSIHSFGGSFTPALGHVITLISNQTGSAVAGTFTGLLEGAVTTTGGTSFKVSYVGGTGHDVTLTVVLPTDVWTGAADDFNWSTAGNWQGGVAPVSGQPVDFPDLGSASAIVLGSDVTVGDISFEGQYTLSGAGVTVQGGITSSGTGTQIHSDLVLAQNTTVTVGASDDLTLASVGSGSNAYGLTKQGAGLLILPATGTFTYTGTTTITQGTLEVDQTLDSNITVVSGATLEGSGTAHGIVSTDGIIVLGGGSSTPDVLSSSGDISFNNGSTLKEVIALNGGAETDGQLIAQGTTVNLGSSTLDIVMPNGFTALTDHTITLISNQTGQAIVGTFNGLAEGTTAAFNGIQYRISYTGGQSGRDVTLTHVIPVASRLVFTHQPASAMAGQNLGTVVVNVVDANGNLVTADNSTVSLACGTALGGVSTAAAVNGVATFTGLSISQVGAFTLSATDGSLTPATSNSFTITPAAPALLFISLQPSDHATAGQPLGTVSVEIEDAFGNVVADDSSNVTISARSGVTGASDSLLTGTTTVAAQNGLAVFSNLAITTSGTYTLKAADGGLPPAITAPITVTAPPVPAPTLPPTPTNVVAAGKAIAPLVIDSATSFPQASGHLKWLNVRVKNDATGGNAAPSRRIQVKDGHAVLKNLKIHQAGVYDVVVSDASGHTMTQQVTVVASAPAKLAFVTRPAVLDGHSPITVQVLDGYGNLSTADDGKTVTLHLGWSNLLGRRPALSGTVSATIVNGIATFTNVSAVRIGGAGLIATSGQLAVGRSRAVLTAGQ